MYNLFTKRVKNGKKTILSICRSTKKRAKIEINKLPPLWTLTGTEYTDYLTVEPRLEVSQPVLNGSEIDDFDAEWVADPFIQFDSGRYYLFAEAAKKNYPENGACLVWYESDDGLTWEYQGKVLDVQPDSDMTDSYPQVIKYQGDWFLVPSFYRGDPVNDLQVYKFDNFPSNVKLTYSDIKGKIRGDPTLFRSNNVWYCVFEDFDYNLQLYYSDSFLRPNWKKHPCNPIETERKLRPGGRPIVHDSGVDFFTQGPRSDRISLLYHRITDVSPETFTWKEVEPSPILHPASIAGRWNELSMHHIDFTISNNSEPIIVVDGKDRNGNYSIGIYGVSNNSSYLNTKQI